MDGGRGKMTEVMLAFAIGFCSGGWLFFRIGVWAEDKFDVKDGYNYRRITSPGGKVIVLPRKRK